MSWDGVADACIFPVGRDYQVSGVGVVVSITAMASIIATPTSF